MRCKVGRNNVHKQGRLCYGYYIYPGRHRAPKIFFYQVWLMASLGQAEWQFTWWLTDAGLDIRGRSDGASCGLSP